MRRRSDCGVSPLLMAIPRGGQYSPDRVKSALSSESGLIQISADVVVQRLEWRNIEHADSSSGHFPAISSFIAHRKAAIVLPLPVGAVMRTCSPAAMRGQASVCRSVGTPMDSANQPATSGWK